MIGLLWGLSKVKESVVCIEASLVHDMCTLVTYILRNFTLSIDKFHCIHAKNEMIYHHCISCSYMKTRPLMQSDPYYKVQKDNCMPSS